MLQGKILTEVVAKYAEKTFHIVCGTGSWVIRSSTHFSYLSTVKLTTLYVSRTAITVSRVNPRIPPMGLYKVHIIIKIAHNI